LTIVLVIAIGRLGDFYTAKKVGGPFCRQFAEDRHAPLVIKGNVIQALLLPSQLVWGGVKQSLNFCRACRIQAEIKAKAGF
jgi:hypothetical protein